MELDFLEFDLENVDEFGNGNARVSDDDDEEGEVGPTESAVAETKAFWVEQHRLLQDDLCRSSVTETRIRSEVEEALTRMRSAGAACTCAMEWCCRRCMLSYVADRLRGDGYNSAVCKSKWHRSPDVPSGEHSYIEVVVEPKHGRKGPIRVVVELNFREEFEMARASREYNGLVGRLPEVFVGKSERLRSVVKTMCSAAKRCAKENGMHLAPWRKHKYVQSKWFGTCERVLLPSASVVPTTEAPAQRLVRPRASMLTFDLHCTAVEVV